MRDPTVHETRPVLITRAFILLFAAHLLFGLSFWPYVLLPVFLQQLGADLFTVGLIMGTASFSGILIRPWVGAALDRIGRRKILIAGGAIFLGANLSYLAIDEVGWTIFVVRLLHGLGMGILMAAFFTLAADLSPATRRTEGIALFGVSGHLSGAIGVLAGEQIIRLGGYPALFLSSATLALLSIFTSLFIREPETPSHDAEPEGFFSVLKGPALRIPLLGTVAFSFSMTSYMVFLKPYALKMGIGSITPFFIAYTLTAVTVRLAGSSWPDRFGLKKVLYPSMISMAVGIVALLFWPTHAGLIVGGVLSGIGHGFIFPILSVMLIERAREENRGSAITLFTMLYDLGLFIGAPLLGFIAIGERYGRMYIAAAAVLMVSLIAFIRFDREKGEGESGPPLRGGGG
ncbi:MAG: MFS transporter [Candidatus Manganitrophus sp.]|nr:MAG: MFS transporter [Candidatus Manganitrophus sp.]